MERVLIPKPVVWVVGDVLGTWYYSHSKLNTLFGQAGAPGEPPGGNCIVKSQNWLFRVNEDESIDPIAFLGDLLSSFMSLDVADSRWQDGRERILAALVKGGLEYCDDGTIAPARMKAEVVEQESVAANYIPTRSDPDFTSRKFRVALSFPGEKRAYVEAVAKALLPHLEEGEVFYDYWFQAHLARPNLDLLLQDLYLNRADLVVVFLCRAYEQKDWPWIEWKAIRQLLKQRKDDSIMFVRFDGAAIPGTFPTDGFIDATSYTPKETAAFVLQRIDNTQDSPPAENLAVSDRDLPNDEAKKPRLVCPLPRGLMLIENIEPGGVNWTMEVNYFDFVEGWVHATHYHPSYASDWKEPGAIDIQCFKVGLPKADWIYARHVFYLLTHLGEAETLPDIRRIVSNNSNDERPIKFVEAGETIYPNRFADNYPDLLKTHGLRDLICEIETLVDPASERWGSLHEMTFSLRLRATTELAKVFELSHPSHVLISELLNQHGSKTTDADLLQWLRLVKVALIDTVMMLRRAR